MTEWEKPDFNFTSSEIFPPLCTWFVYYFDFPTRRRHISEGANMKEQLKTAD